MWYLNTKINIFICKGYHIKYENNVNNPKFEIRGYHKHLGRIMENKTYVDPCDPCDFVEFYVWYIQFGTTF
jgi:hypothetical protein